VSAEPLLVAHPAAAETEIDAAAAFGADESASLVGGAASKRGHERVNLKGERHQRVNEQALVRLFNREIVDASRGCTFHCKMANNRFFL